MLRLEQKSSTNKKQTFMQNNLNQEIAGKIDLLNLFLERTSTMLIMGKQGVSPFPLGVEFNEQELKSLDNSLRILVAKILGQAEIDESVFFAPMAYAYRYGFGFTKWSWLEKFHEGLFNSKRFLMTHLTQEIPSNVTIHISGPGAIVGINEIGILTNNFGLEDGDLSQLAEELIRLRGAMKLESQASPEEDIAVAAVAAAEIAAQRGDKLGILQHLKEAGKWAFKVATEIGVSVAASVIEGQLPR